MLRQAHSILMFDLHLSELKLLWPYYKIHLDFSALKADFVKLIHPQAI